MSETPTGGGSAFWAARGVRIEPEPAEQESEYEGGYEDAGDAAAVPAVPAQPTDPTAVVLAVAVTEPEDHAETDADAADPTASSEPAILIDSLDPVDAADSQAPIEVAGDESGPADAFGSPGDAAVESPVETVVEPDIAVETESVASTVATEPEPALEPLVEADADPDPDPDLDPAAEVPFIPTQATFDEVEPQVGVPVDGLVALNGTLIDAARAKAEREAKAAEPVWQLTDDNLTALPDLRTCLEAILLVVDEPVTEVMLAQIVERPTEQVAAALRALSAEYTSQGRGFDLREVGIGDGSLVTQTGWRFYTRAECAPVVERYIRDGQQSKLTQAALETLAVVAYRQPVSRSKVSAIRGVNCDGVMRTLLARGLVEECGTEYETGALLYRTTGYFLERMGLKGLEELPDLAPLLPSAADMEDEV